jgi:hypothetical protein
MGRVLFGCAVLAGSFVSLPIAMANVYNLPIGIVATLSDGTALSGEFTLNQYGYVEDGTVDTLAGYALDGTTPISGGDFVSLNIENNTNNVLLGGTGAYSLTLTFEYSLGTPGLDPFVLDAGYSQNPRSGECYPYACNDYGGIDNPSKERLVASGYAMVPEPASAVLLGVGLPGAALLSLLAGRRRQA